MKNDVVVAVLATAVALLGAVIISALLFWVIKSRRKLRRESQVAPEAMKRRRFSHLELVNMTDNFQHVVGRGGFGTVYRGVHDGAPVAVKLYRGIRADQGFESEVNYLNKVYHKNLINLVGYCKESTELALVFEFMANGDLRKNLTEGGSINLTWESRLGIAIDVGKGLDYLHQGCNPPIIHRDIKSSNILLAQNFEAKISEFSLAVDFISSYGDDDEPHVSIEIAGTIGYIDPQYLGTGKLTMRSDVYGFGVVLMEIITGKPAFKLPVEEEPFHLLAQWVSSMFGNGDIEGIVDPKLEGEFDINSVEEALKIAISCVSENTHDRPEMDQVIVKLKSCLQMERARLMNERISSTQEASYQ